MKKPTVSSSRNLAKGDFYTLREDLLIRPDGKKGPYISLNLNGDAALIIAQDREGRYILNREYRHPTGQYVLGCPGGRIEPGEDPLEAGKRELLEESGYAAGEIQLIGSCYPFPGLCNQKIYFLWAQNCHNTGKQNLDPLECIETELKTEEELRKEILTESNIDGLLCIALWYKETLNIQ